MKMTAKLRSKAESTHDSLVDGCRSGTWYLPPAGNLNGQCGRRSRPPATDPVRITGPRGVTARPVCRLSDLGLLPFALPRLPVHAPSTQLDVSETSMGSTNLGSAQVKLGSPKPRRRD